MYQYQVSFTEAISRAFSKYCCFTGRASRSEYWWFCLFGFIVGLVFGLPKGILGGLNYLDAADGVNLVSQIVSLAFLLPSLGLFFRRMHDTNRSGWNILWILLPVVGFIILLIYLTKSSCPAENKYGPVPNIAEAR